MLEKRNNDRGWQLWGIHGEERVLCRIDHKADVLCPKERTKTEMEEKMKEKKLEKAEMKESILTGEALALNDAELEGATGGISESEREAIYAEVRETLEKMHEASKGGGNSLVEVVDCNMSPEEIEQKYGFEFSKLNEQMMQDRLNKIEGL